MAHDASFTDEEIHEALEAALRDRPGASYSFQHATAAKDQVCVDFRAKTEPATLYRVKYAR